MQEAKLEKPTIIKILQWVYLILSIPLAILGFLLLPTFFNRDQYDELRAATFLFAIFYLITSLLFLLFFLTLWRFSRKALKGALFLALLGMGFFGLLIIIFIDTVQCWNTAYALTLGPPSCTTTGELFSIILPLGLLLLVFGYTFWEVRKVLRRMSL